MIFTDIIINFYKHYLLDMAQTAIYIVINFYKHYLLDITY